MSPNDLCIGSEVISMPRLLFLAWWHLPQIMSPTLSTPPRLMAPQNTVTTDCKCLIYDFPRTISLQGRDYCLRNPTRSAFIRLTQRWADYRIVRMILSLLRIHAGPSATNVNECIAVFQRRLFPPRSSSTPERAGHKDMCGRRRP